MKRFLPLFLVGVMLLSLCACGNTSQPEQTTTEPQLDVYAKAADIAKLDGLYTGRELRYGEMHSHADTGGTSDGKVTLTQWKTEMLLKGVDFATIVDHKQMLHMELPEWDNAAFLGGSEAGGYITDSPARNNNLHYNMLFATVEDFKSFLDMPIQLVKFQFFGGHFKYPNWTVEEMNQLSRDIYANGGLLVHVHPNHNGYMDSDDPLDYFFGDVMGYEVFTGYHGDMTYPDNQKQYQMWTKLLALGKRAYATCGSDSHGNVSNMPISLGTVYTQNKDASEYLSCMRSGNMTAGPAGIRMCVGDTQMGGEVSFAGQRLVLAVDEIHDLTYKVNHTYRVDLYDDKGLVFSEEISGKEPAYFAMDANPDAKYYHANVYDVTADCIIAIGNPIWNADATYS